MAEEVERWLAVADNRGEWERLRRALALEQGFALLIVDVPDVGTQGRVIELLAGEQQPLVVLDAQASEAQAPVRELLARRGERVVLRGVEASRSDIEALERCLVQLNMRRDQIVAREHVLVIVLRRDAVARMIGVAPDLYSVHRARFRFARLVVPRPAPAWLLSDLEFAAVLDDDGRPLEQRLAHYESFFAAPEPFELPPGERVPTLVQTHARDRIAARIFARREGVHCLAWSYPRDLANALDAPTLDSAEILRDSLQLAQTAGNSQLVYMCANALTWMHLQQSEFAEARTLLDEAVLHQRYVWNRFGSRHQLLSLQLGVAEGLADPGPHVSLEGWVVDDWWLGAIYLSLAERQCELWADTSATGNLRLALDHGVEMLPFNKWRLDASLRLMPPALVEATVSQNERVEVITWLDERQLEGNLGWDETWTKHLMIERAIGHSERVARLVDLGRKWVEVHSNVYEVWRPLVEIHAQTRDTTTLEQLIRMPLTSGAEQRFGPRLAAALHIVADLVDRGLVELTNLERDELRAQAAAREALPPAIRLGWWAIEIALNADS